jgi:hypothetical protein
MRTADGKRVIVRADDLLTAFLSLERGRSNAIARSEEHKKLAYAEEVP